MSNFGISKSGEGLYTEKPIEVHISGLSGLRTLGIFGVILYHMFPYDVKGGFLGVTLFFIISGYLLAVKSEESRRINSFNVGKFYIKRVKRLYPQLLIVLFATCGVLGVFMPQVLQGKRPEIISIIFGYNNFWQIAQNASYFERIANASPFTHMWSLANEIQMYLIWPLIFMLFIYLVKKLNSQKAIMIIGIMALATAVIMPVLYTPGEDVTRLYYGTDTRIFSFLTGAYIGFRRTRYRRTKPVKDLKPFYIAFGVLFAVVIVSYIFMDGEAAFTYRGGMFLMNMVFAAMLIITTDTRLPVGKYMDNKYLSFFGKISYEMYLWMFPVIFLFYGLHLNRIPGAPVLMIVIIVLLSKWLNMFALFLVRRKFDFKGTIMKKTSQIIFAAVACVAIVLAVKGVSDVVTAPDKDNSDISIMQKELEEHANLISQQNDGESGQVAAEDSEKDDQSGEDKPSKDQKNEKNEKDDEGQGDTDGKAQGEDGEEGQNEEEGGSADSDTEKGVGEDTENNGDDQDAEEETSSSMVASVAGDMPWGKVTAVGDSVMLGAAPALMDVFPDCVVDAKESRQVSATLDILKDLDSRGQLGDIVVIGMGTNGSFRESTGQEIVDYLGPDRKIYWVNVFGESIQWADDSNNTIEKIVDNNKNVTLIDWHSEGLNHPDWFYNDGIHLKPEGQRGYADFVKSCIVG